MKSDFSVLGYVDSVVMTTEMYVGLCHGAGKTEKSCQWTRMAVDDHL